MEEGEGEGAKVTCFVFVIANFRKTNKNADYHKQPPKHPEEFLYHGSPTK
jgi:hypothetical protein